MAQSSPSYPSYKFFGRLHWGYYDKEKDKCFCCGLLGNMVRNYPINKVDLGANKVIVASSSALTVKNAPSGSGTS